MGIKVKISHRVEDFILEGDWSSDKRRIGLFGPSGCGKTMTLKCMAGILTPKEGKIEINDVILLDTREKINVKPQKRRVGYLFQSYALFPNMSVRKNIEMGLSGRQEKLSRKERELAADELLERFQIKELAGKLPGNLSGGEKQRTALARIMAYEPETILLDEPFSAMDRELKEQLYEEMEIFLEDYPGTTILVSHDYEEMKRFSEEIIYMKKEN